MAEASTGTELAGERDVNPFLALYYSRVFPFNDFYRWLTYNRQVSITNRELVFDCGTEGTHEHQSFADAVALKSKLRRLRPDKIEVGAAYSKPPKNIGNVPVEKEFVVDIDLVNFGHVRYCCVGNKVREVCHDCHELLVLGMKIIDRQLRKENFNHVLWVHHTTHMYAWVCDKRARLLPNSFRKQLIDKLQHARFFKGVTVQGRYCNMAMGNESLRLALADIRLQFQRILMQQNLFEDTPEKMAHLMSILPNNTVRRVVHSLIRSLEGQNSCQKYTELVKLIRSRIEMEDPDRPHPPWEGHEDLMDQIALWYVYPRLNRNASISICLPLIAPFTTNADTGEIAIPVDIDVAKGLNPYRPITIERIMEDVEPAIRDGQLDVADNTCLKPHLKVFREFLTNLFNSNDHKEERIKYQEPAPVDEPQIFDWRRAVVMHDILKSDSNPGVFG